MNKRSIYIGGAILLVLVIWGTLFYSGTDNITIYSGRSENLIGPVFEKFTEETGIEVNVRYGGTAELAATILEEGDNTPADIFFAQDAGALGALAYNDRLQKIPDKYLQQVDSRLRSHQALWIGTSGRARIVGYNTNQVQPDQLPDSIWGFTDPQWEGKIGWAPTNGSFQAFITAFRELEGDEKTLEWLKGILANNPRNYENNTSIVSGLGRGEVAVGFVNHYYLFRFIAEQGESFPVNNHYTIGDAGSMINIAGIGILNTTEYTDQAYQLIEFILSLEIQQHFINENSEYPVIAEISIDNPLILPLEEIKTPDIDLTNLKDLEGTLELLREAGAL